MELKVDGRESTKTDNEGIFESSVLFDEVKAQEKGDLIEFEAWVVDNNIVDLVNVTKDDN
jgi:hypothetical protein